MNDVRLLSLCLLFLSGAAFAQGAAPSPIATDRPGFLFSSLTVGHGVLQTEWSAPAATLVSDGNDEFRFTSLAGLVRYGVSDQVELRLGGPVYSKARLKSRGRTVTGHGYGDLEAGLKWHLLDNDGARPSFALIPSVILPTGEDGFTADDPVYQLNAAAEWTLADGWGLAALACYLNGSDGDGRYGHETFGVALGRSLPSPRWSAYGEAVYVATDLAGEDDVAYLGGGLKFLVDDDFQLDVSADRSLTGGSADWLLGFGFSARF